MLTPSGATAVAGIDTIVRSALGLMPSRGVTIAFVCRLLLLTCLAPDIVEAILDGRQPRG